MTSFLYLGLLVGALACMALVDHRARLVLWSGRPWRAAVVLVVGAALFLGWDVVAIGAGFYSRGGAAMTGVELRPHLPLEELFFIVFLCYVTLVLHGVAGHLLGRRQGGARARDDAAAPLEAP
ncbi:lycopene cyclase domain-containing protein [Isoptericola aurantiacus]|uniref:lycopene cyclase domain-containing protein n=1 Tax=Isoptericola aurantiacus TaxID=3377839 RepID=UPI00383BE77B